MRKIILSWLVLGCFVLFASQASCANYTVENGCDECDGYDEVGDAAPMMGVTPPPAESTGSSNSTGGTGRTGGAGTDSGVVVGIPVVDDAGVNPAPAVSSGSGRSDGGSVLSDSGSSAMSDAGSAIRSDAASDVRTDAGSDVVSSEPVDAVALAATTCGSRTLSRLPPGLFRSGYTVYHLCYQTPVARMTTQPLASQRSSSVLFSRRSMTSASLIDLVRVPAPMSANPWSSSVVVAIPNAPIGAPVFGVHNEIASNGGAINSYPAVAVDTTTGRLTLSGTLHIYTVTPDGRQTEVSFHPLANACVDAVSQGFSSGGNILVSNGACPLDLARCNPAPWHCQ